MENKEEEAFNKLIQVAMNNVHTELDIILNKDEYVIAKAMKSGLKKVLKAFKKAKNGAFNDYKNYLDLDESNATESLADFRLLSNCFNFYNEELLSINMVLRDYEDFIWSNPKTMINHLTGYDRYDIDSEYVRQQTEEKLDDEDNPFDEF